MVQANSLLYETVPGQRRIAWLDADGGSRADTIEELIAVVDHLHAEFWEQLAVEFAGDLEAAHGQDDVSHAIYFDGHRPRLSPRRATKSVQTPFGFQTASISARAWASSIPRTSRR